jgi:hypothetical protein
MKKIIFSVVAAITMALSASAQTDTTTKPQPATDSAMSQSRTDTAGKAATGSSYLVNVDSNLPEHLKGVTSSTVQPKHYLPVLGGYASADGAVNLNVVVDEQNMGLIWIEGLPQGRVKGLLKKGPATYKIPAQKTAEGKAVAEGTLIYDKDMKQLSLCTGCKFNEADPAAVFTGKTKAKVWQLNRVEEGAIEPMQQ